MTALLPVNMMTDVELAAETEALIRADKDAMRRWACPDPNCDGLPHTGWLHLHARGSQHIPPWWWTEWVIMAGRGWGKTRTASETVRVWAQEPNLQIAVIAKKETLVREICFESPKSGLLSVIPKEEILSYARTPGAIRMRLRNGTTIWGFGAEVPDNLRGWAFDKAWCDEYAAWTRNTAQETYDMLWFCLREARHPQVIISTTPKPLKHVRALIEKRKLDAEANIGVPDYKPDVVLVQGHMFENKANLSPAAMKQMEAKFAGTRQGRQELGGELLGDVEGALWKAWMFEVDEFRLAKGSPRVPHLDRLVVAFDPAVTSTDDADMSAFVVAGRSNSFDATYRDGLPHGYALHAEQDRYTPRAAMKRLAALYHEFQADVVVIEANNGGEYLPAVLEMVDPTVPWKIVHASRGKRARATPVATLYEAARVHHVGTPKDFDEVEGQMLTYIGQGPDDEDSPDLLDALVWAFTDLLLDPVEAAGGSGFYQDERLEGR